AVGDVAAAGGIEAGRAGRPGRGPAVRGDDAREAVADGGADDVRGARVADGDGVRGRAARGVRRRSVVLGDRQVADELGRVAVGRAVVAGRVGHARRGAHGGGVDQAGGGRRA